MVIFMGKNKGLPCVITHDGRKYICDIGLPFSDYKVAMFCSDPEMASERKIAALHKKSPAVGHYELVAENDLSDIYFNRLLLTIHDNELREPNQEEINHLAEKKFRVVHTF
jgi:hypothetical protein